MREKPSLIIELPDGFTDVVSWICALESFVERYRHVASFNSRDLFTLNFWDDVISKDWSSSIEDIWHEIDDLDEWMELWSRIASNDSSSDDIKWLTDDLKSFVDQCRSLGLKQQMSHRNTDLTYRSQNMHIMRGIDRKKVHEIECITQYIKQILSEYNGISGVLDVGCGVGSLSLTLASEIIKLKKHVNVHGIDGKEIHIETARRRLDVLQKKESTENESISDVEFTNNFIEGAEDLNNLMIDKGLKYLICSLHACGNLSPYMLQCFIDSPDVEAIVNVGCCYQLLDEEITCNKDCAKNNRMRFPLSKFVNIQLGERLRTLAVQASQKWPSMASMKLMFHKHVYRAVLQHSLVKYGICEAKNLDRTHTTGKLKSRYFRNGFVPYALEAQERLNYERKLSANQLQESWEELKPFIYQVIAQVSLRAMCAPAVESLILADRACFLHHELNLKWESGGINGGRVALVEMFDTKISPRNWAVVGLKYK